MSLRYSTECLFLANGYFPASQLPKIVKECLSGWLSCNSNCWPLAGLLMRVPLNWKLVPTLVFKISSNPAMSLKITTWRPFIEDPSWSSMKQRSFPPGLTVLAQPATVMILYINSAWLSNSLPILSL